MTTASEIITSIGVSSGAALVQDIKGSITSWTKDASTTGHFNVANAAVTIGCIVTFADASTRTIIAKTGDGTAANNITLSSDHASDFALASITGLIFSSPNLTINSAYGNPTTVGTTAVGDTSGTQAYTVINITALTNGKYITACSIYLGATSASRTLKFKICKVNGSNFDVVDLQTFTQTSSGVFTGTLSTPYLIPNDAGTYYLAVYQNIIQAGDNWQNANTGGGRAYKAGDISGTNVSGWTSDAYGERTSATLKEIGPTALFAANTNTIQLNSSTWSGMSAVTATQTLAGSSTIWHAVSFNKGNSSEVWQVYLSSAWRSIVQKSGSLWQYNNSADATPSWVNATVNSRLGALSQAFGVAGNQMSKTAIEAITAPQWASRFVAGTLDFAAGLTADGINLPVLSQWGLTYTPAIAGAATGHSTVAGSVAASMGKLLGAITPFATVAGSVAASQGKLLGAATGQSTVAGTMKLPGDIYGHVTGQATVVGAIQAKGRLAGAASGHSTPTGHAYAFIAPNTFIPIIQWRRVPR